MHMRHMQLRELFLKQIVQQGMVIITKLGTKEPGGHADESSEPQDT